MEPREIFSHWEWVREGTIETIGLFKDDELAYQPGDGIWSVGQIMAHIANAEEGWFRYVITRELTQWPDEIVFENYPSKDRLLDLLEEVHARTRRYLETLAELDLGNRIQAPWDQQLPLQWIIWHVMEHEIHHRGELSLLLGLLGRRGLEV